MIIDEHIHLGGLFKDTDYFLKCLDDAGIDMVLAAPYMFEDKNIPKVLKMKGIPPALAGTKPVLDLVSMVMKNKRFARRYIKKLPNDYVAEMTRKYPDRIYGVYWMNPNEEELSNVEEYLKDNHFVAIKLHQILYPCDLTGKNQAIFDLAVDYDVPLFIHVSNCDEIRTIMKYMEKKPNFRVILAHMAFYEETAEEICDFSNIYLDVSPLYSNRDEKIINAIERIGADRIIFGTDAPCPGMQKYAVHRIKNLNISEEEKEKILSKNIFQLIHHRVCLKN